MRNACTGKVAEYVSRDRNVIAITADGKNPIYDSIKQNYPNQYIDYGIAESNMVASAAGLASCGKIPFLFTITNFMSMRAFEFIRNDVCMANRNVKFIGVFSGMSRGALGPTHEGTEEVALLRSLPNMLVITPATPNSAAEAARIAYEHEGPVYIRLETSFEPELYDENYHMEEGKGCVVKNGDAFTIICTGSVINEALGAADVLQKEGISVRVIDMPFVKPIDRELIMYAVAETKGIIALEEHSIYGGLGSAVAEVMAEGACRVPLIRMGLDGFPKGAGNQKLMRVNNKISSEYIMQVIKEKLDMQC